MSRKEILLRKQKKLMEENGIIYLNNVTKSYSKGSPALNGVTLSIYQGEFVFVVGDSGSGKSTLIRLLLRELTATSGNVYVMGSGGLKAPQNPEIPPQSRSGVPGFPAAE